MALDVVELDLQHPWFGPFAIRAERDVANQRVKRMRTQVLCQLRLIRAVDALDGLAQDLKVGIGEGR